MGGWDHHITKGGGGREWCIGVCLVKTDDDNVEDEKRGTQLSRNVVFESVAAAAHSSR